MSEGMFLGRKFAIPYDNTTDKQVASIARAQLTTGTASPGAVIQVGDTVMAYGVTPQQAKMGDLDIRLRSFEQISNQAQEVVRQNIQWQYGEQVGEIKKSWWRKLLGMPHPDTSLKDLYPDSPAPKERDWGSSAGAPASAQKKSPAVPAPAPATPAPASSSPASATPKKPSSKKASPKPPAAAPASAPAPASSPAAASAPATEVAADFVAAHPDVQQHLTTAYHGFARRHKSARDASQWEVSRSFPNPNSMVSTARHKDTDALETHEFSYDPATHQVTHRFKSPTAKDPMVSTIDLEPLPNKEGKKKAKKPDLASYMPSSLYDYVRSDNDQWVF